MKKTITINISGAVFNIDEDAYDKLKSYLSSVSDYFNKENGGHEIIFDIESRIAELFNERISESQNVITLTMVDEVISVMGSPEEFTASEDNSAQDNSNNNNPVYPRNTYTRAKRLYRDTDSRVIGGVCSGLAHYFNIDKILMRIIFVILLFVTSGILIPAYLILWIAVPKARTTSQRLEMKGEPINIENIGRSVKEEMNEQDNGKGSSAKDSRRNIRNAAQNRNYENNSPGILSKILGIILVFLGFISLAGLIVSIFVSTKMIGMLPGFFHEYGSYSFLNHFFTNSTLSTLMFALLIIAGIPILLFIYAGTKLIFNYNSNNKSVIFSSLGIWFIGVIIAIASIVGAVNVFSTSTNIEDNSVLSVSSDTIYISSKDYDSSVISEPKYEINNWKVIDHKGNEVIAANPVLRIEKSGSSNMELVIKKSSKGNNIKAAEKNAMNIEYNYSLDGSKIVLDPYFLLKKHDKWRSQKCILTLKVPDGKVIFFDESILPLIQEIENTSDTWVGDMINSYWVMKPEGLSLSTPK
jgi:phage shock protein PspC (stress-responsive transcriptional regulator)